MFRVFLITLSLVLPVSLVSIAHASGDAEKEKTAPAPASKSIPVAKLERTTPVDFEKEVLPVLRTSCLACHSRTKPKAGLVLETPADIRKGGENGPAAVPGKGGESLMVKASAHEVEDGAMPPPDNKVNAPNLTPEQLGLIKLWIDQGAAGEVRSSVAVTWQPVPRTFNPIYAVTVSPDGQYAACGRGNRVHVYHLPTGKLVAEVADPAVAKAFSGAAPAGSGESRGGAHRDLVQSLAFSPDGRLLASGSYREVKLWRRPEAAKKFELAVSADAKGGPVAATGDGKVFATGGADGVIRLWDAAKGDAVGELTGHEGPVTALRFSPDGARLLSGSSDKTVRAWDVAGRKLIARADAGAEVGCVAWAAAGKKLAAGGADGTVRLWDTPDGDGKPELGDAKELKGHKGPVTGLDAAPAADAPLVSGGEDGTVRLWDAQSGNTVKQLKHGAPVTAVAARSDGKRFATAGSDNTARLWDPGKDKPLAEPKGDRDAVAAVAMKERALASANSELGFRKSRLAETEKQEKAQSDRVAKATESAAAAEKALAEVKKKLDATAEEKGADEKDKKEEKEKKEKDVAKAAEAEKELKKAESAKTSAEGELSLAKQSKEAAATAVAEARAAAEAAESEQKRRADEVAIAKQAAGDAEKPVRTVAFSPDGLTLATAGDDGAVHLWSGEDGAAAEVLARGPSSLRAVTFAGANTVIAAGPDRPAAAWGLDGAWQLVRTLGTGDGASPLSDRVNALDFSPDGRFLATGGGIPSRAGEIRLWDVASGRQEAAFDEVHTDAVFALDFSPDGNRLASGAADRFLRVINLAARPPATAPATAPPTAPATPAPVVRTFEGHTHHVLGVSWKADGRTLVSAGADNTVKVWDADSGERKKNVTGFDKEVTAVAFVGNTDQFLAASGEGKVKLVNEGGADVRAFPGAGNDFVYAVTATPDGKWVVAGGQDGALRVWNAADGKAVATLEPPKD